MKILKLKNDLVKLQQQWFELGGLTDVRVESNPYYKKVAETTSGMKLALDNLYTIKLTNRLNGDKIELSFLCNAKEKSHTYTSIQRLVKNNRNYYSSRYFCKYIPLVGEIAHGLRLQFKELH